MKEDTRQVLLGGAFVLIPLFLAALATGGLQSVWFYSLAGGVIGILAARVGQWAFRWFIGAYGTKMGLMAGATVGWLVVAGVLLTINLVTAQRVTWAVYPALGLALWPVGTGLLLAFKKE